MRENQPIRCPNCESQARTERYSTTTCMAYTKGYYDDNGVYYINSDPNTTTTYWKCSSCGEDYVSYTQYGKTYQVR